MTLDCKIRFSHTIIFQFGGGALARARGAILGVPRLTSQNEKFTDVAQRSNEQQTNIEQ